MSGNPYEILGVSEEATAEQVAALFKMIKAAKSSDPAYMKRAQWAYDTVCAHKGWSANAIRGAAPADRAGDTVAASPLVPDPEPPADTVLDDTRRFLAFIRGTRLKVMGWIGAGSGGL